MPSITRKTLARGTKLTVEGVYQPLTDIAAQLSTAAVEQSQYDTQKNGTFRLNWNIPRVTSALWETQFGAVKAAYTGTVVGAPGAGDVIFVTLGDGRTYQYYNFVAGGVGVLAAGLKDAMNLGSIDEYDITLGNATGAGQVYTLVMGTNTYTYVTVGADVAAVIVAALAAAAIGDTVYNCAGGGPSLRITKVARGKGTGVSLTSTGPGAITVLRPVVGEDKQVEWVASNVAGAFTATHAMSGPTTDSMVGGVQHLAAGAAVFDNLALTSAGVAYTSLAGHLCAGFSLPPLQDLFHQDRRMDAEVPFPLLTEVDLSWDQRAENYGIVDDYNGSNVGKMTPVDMARYTMVFQLMCKVPYLYDQTAQLDRVVLQFTLPGDAAFGGVDSRQNPFHLDQLSIPIDPYRAYYWTLDIPGLIDVPVRLACPGLNVSLKLQYPLTKRDASSGSAHSPTIQNIPEKTLGQKQLAPVVVTLPSANAVIAAEGPSGPQTAIEKLDAHLLDRLRGGYDAESETFPAEQLANDCGYDVICVPLWGAWEDVRASNVATAGLPYISAPWKTPTCDSRQVKVPQGWVLHHVLACKSVMSPPTPATRGNAGFGILPSAADYHEKIGVGLCNGGGDDYTYQQLAYVDVAGNEWNTKALDTGNGLGVLLPVPLVSDVPHAFSWPVVNGGTGYPIFVGQGDAGTASRTWVGQMPPDYGGGALAAPVTKGAETFLEVRWTLEDTVNGLNNGATPLAVLVGFTGNYVLLIGRKTTV